MIYAVWEKRFDANSQAYYYVNIINDEVSWTKPRLLGSDDLPLAPDEWRVAYDDEGNRYYTNPATGQTSWLSMDDAAKAVQRAYRQKQAEDYGKPTLEQMIRALRMQKEVEEKFASNPSKLSSIVNYALLLHTQTFDLPGARKHYKDAMAMSPENPVLLRAYGIFRLVAVEAPRQAIFDQASDMFQNAALRDPDGERFQLSEETMFHWAVISRRDHPVALLNYAVMLQAVAKDYDRAERFYHRAISLLNDGENFSMYRPNVMENYDTFQVERLPGGRYETDHPTGAVVRNCQLEEQRPEWAEWNRMVHTNPRKPTMPFFLWMNSLSGRATWKEPVWDDVRQARIDRSHFVGERQGWSEFFDPSLNSTFFYHAASFAVSDVDPTEVRALTAHAAAAASKKVVTLDKATGTDFSSSSETTTLVVARSSSSRDDDPSSSYDYDDNQLVIPTTTTHDRGV